MTPDETRDRVESVLREVAEGHRLHRLPAPLNLRCHCGWRPFGLTEADHREHVASEQAAALGEVLADVWDAGYQAGENFEAARWVGVQYGEPGPRPPLTARNPYRAEGGDRG